MAGGCGERQHVHPDWASVDDGQETDLIWDGLEDGIALAQVVFPGFVDVAHGRGGGREAGFGLELMDAIPNFALIRIVLAVGFERCLDGPGFAGTRLPRHEVAGFAEGLGGVGPAALLGATDWDHGRGNSLDQDGGVEDAVLLGAGNFFPIHEEDGVVGAVDNLELGDGAMVGGFGDGDFPGGEGFAQGMVLKGAIGWGDDGQDGDVLVGLGFTELNGLQPSFHYVFDGFSFFWANGGSLGV